MRKNQTKVENKKSSENEIKLVRKIAKNLATFRWSLGPSHKILYLTSVAKEPQMYAVVRVSDITFTSYLLSNSSIVGRCETIEQAMKTCQKYLLKYKLLRHSDFITINNDVQKLIRDLKEKSENK